MTDTLEATDLELIELLDFEPELRCEDLSGCDHTARFVSRCYVCGHARPICRPHADYRVASPNWYCSNCKMGTVRYLDLFRLTPIGPS